MSPARGQGGGKCVRAPSHRTVCGFEGDSCHTRRIGVPEDGSGSDKPILKKKKRRIDVGPRCVIRTYL